MANDKTTAPTVCLCGCDGETKGGLFRPGHDARLVSQAVAAAFGDGANPVGAEGDDHQAIYDALAKISQPLAAKYDRAVAARQALGEAKVARDAARAEARQAKAEAKAAAAVAKAEAKAKAKAEAVDADDADDDWPYDDADPAFAYGAPVRVGRWDYPSRVYPDGRVERNTKRDGSGEWVAYTAA